MKMTNRSSPLKDIAILIATLLGIFIFAMLAPVLMTVAFFLFGGLIALAVISFIAYAIYEWVKDCL